MTLRRKELMKPSVEKIANAMAYTRTHEMKFGIVVRVCTTRWNFVERSSASKTAKAIGSQLVAMPKPDIISVLRSTRTRSLRVAPLENR